MTNAIAQASIASTNLLNGIQLINRETERVSENAEVVRRFEVCKNLRRNILYYIQNVESDQWIGSLVNANDELVKVRILIGKRLSKIRDNCLGLRCSLYPSLRLANVRYA